MMSSDRGVEKASRLLAPWVDVVSSPAAEALVADSERWQIAISSPKAADSGNICCCSGGVGKEMLRRQCLIRWHITISSLKAVDSGNICRGGGGEAILRCWRIIICSLQAGGAAGGGGNTCCRGRGECTMCDVG